MKMEIKARTLSLSYVTFPSTVLQRFSAKRNNGDPKQK
jgi:hypothetical protein